VPWQLVRARVEASPRSPAAASLPLPVCASNGQTCVLVGPMRCATTFTTSRQLSAQRTAGSSSCCSPRPHPAAARCRTAAPSARVVGTAQRRHHSCTVAAQGLCRPPPAGRKGASLARALPTRGTTVGAPHSASRPACRRTDRLDAWLQCPLVMLTGGASAVQPCGGHDASSLLPRCQTWSGILPPCSCTPCSTP
jgi:hypothetical protein